MKNSTLILRFTNFVNLCDSYQVHSRCKSKCHCSQGKMIFWSQPVRTARENNYPIQDNKKYEKGLLCWRRTQPLCCGEKVLPQTSRIYLLWWHIATEQWKIYTASPGTNKIIKFQMLLLKRWPCAGIINCLLVQQSILIIFCMLKALLLIACVSSWKFRVFSENMCTECTNHTEVALRPDRIVDERFKQNDEQKTPHNEWHDQMLVNGDSVALNCSEKSWKGHKRFQNNQKIPFWEHTGCHEARGTKNLLEIRKDKESDWEQNGREESSVKVDMSNDSRYHLHVSLILETKYAVW